MRNKEISLLRRNQEQKDGDAARPRQKTERQRDRRGQENPEQRHDPAVVLRNHREDVDSRARLQSTYGVQARPRFFSEPVQPVRIEKNQIEEGHQSEQNTEKRDRQR